MDATAILMSLPELELRNLCKLLAREGLSDTAYSRIAEVLKKLAVAAPPHRQLFISELAETARRLGGPALSELESLGDVDTPVISSTSMAGAAMLLVLQALSALTSSGSYKKDSDPVVTDKEQEDGMQIIRDLNSALEKLWFGLSASVGKIESRMGNLTVVSVQTSNVAAAAVVGAGTVPPLPPGTQKLLPFVEGFFVLCEKLRSGPSITGQSEPLSSTAREIKEAACSSASGLDIVTIPRSPPTPHRKADEKGMTFIRFAEKHRRLLNAFIRQNTGLLEKSLSLMLKTPRLIDFDNKRAYFRTRIRHQHEQQHYAPLRICVQRAYVLEDSYNQLRMRTPDELKGRLTVQFQGEEGIDVGGLTREWYQLLSRVNFDKGALLFTTVGNELTFQPNPNSVFQTEHLSYFKFVGRVVARALFDGQLLDVYFTRSFYKHILGVKVLNCFTKEQMSRYECYRRSGFQRANMRRLLASVAGCPISIPVTIVMSGISKMFVGELVEIGRIVMTERNDVGPIRPCHIREAYQRLKLEAEPSRPEEGVFGCGAHSDYGLLTFLTTGLSLLEYPGIRPVDPAYALPVHLVDKIFFGQKQ
ncbi:unnamed protein product [Calypogeia fissa]